MGEAPVVAATFTYRHEAEFALATLRAAGVDAMLVIDDAGGALGGLSLSGPPRLLVREEDVAHARALLAGSGADDREDT